MPKELHLEQFGLEYVSRETMFAAGFADGRSLVFHQDLDRTIEALSQSAPADIKNYRKLAEEQGAPENYGGTIPAVDGETALKIYAAMNKAMAHGLELVGEHSCGADCPVEQVREPDLSTARPMRPGLPRHPV